MRIKAYAITEKGGTAEPFLYERMLGGRDVLVRITQCSLARGGIQYIDNDWGDARYPLVPGHEIVGIVEEISSEVVGLHSMADSGWNRWSSGSPSPEAVA
jgi:D-arabinose 1-dehydrogenase-like Zn-dependent alcohol dehydrogenase